MGRVAERVVLNRRHCDCPEKQNQPNQAKVVICLSYSNYKDIYMFFIFTFTYS